MHVTGNQYILVERERFDMDKAIEAKIIERIIKDESLKRNVMTMDAKTAQQYLVSQGLQNVSEEEAGALLEKMKGLLKHGALTDEELEDVAGGYVEFPMDAAMKKELRKSQKEGTSCFS